MSKQIELLGCPKCFCDAVFDADDFIDGRWRIFCTFCGYGIEGDDAAALIAEWNNRTPPAKATYLPDYITEAHVYLTHDGEPMMMCLWNGVPWLCYWKDDPPTWVSYRDMSKLSGMWDAMHSPLWQRRWLPEEHANLYHKLAFPKIEASA